MYKKSKRFLAGFLALLLVVTMIPTDLLGVVYAAPEKPASVTFDPADGDTLDNETTITLSCETSGAQIKYTTDKSEPSESAGTAGNSVTITPESDNTATIKAVAVATDGTDTTVGDVTTATYTFKAATPEASKAAGEVAKTDSIELTSATESATILYSLDGSEPAETYNGSITLTDITADFTLKAKATKTNYADSEVLEVSYTLKADDPTPAKPTVSAEPDGSSSKHTFGSATGEVTLTASKGDVYYVLSTDSDYATTSQSADSIVTKGQVASGKITISEATTIKAVAKDGETVGDVATFEYDVTADPQPSQIGTVKATPEAGEVAADTTVTLSYEAVASEQAEIYAVKKTAAEIAADGFNAPTAAEIAVEANKYTTPIAITEASTIYAVAKTDDKTGAVQPFAYTVKASTGDTVAAPEASPVSGTEVTANSKVSLTSAEGTKLIYLTSDKANYATITADTIAADADAVKAEGNTAEITITDTLTGIKAIAVDSTDNTKKSTLVTFTYTIKQTGGTTTKDVVYTLNGAVVAAEKNATEALVPIDETTDQNTFGTQGYFTIGTGGKVGPMSADTVKDTEGNSIPRGWSWGDVSISELTDNNQPSETILVTGGKMDLEYKNSIQFTTKTDNAKVVIYAGGKQDNATFVLKYGAAGSGTAVQTTSDTFSKLAIIKYEATLAKAGKYTLGFANGGGIVPFIQVTETVEVSAIPDDPTADPVKDSVLEEGDKVALSVLDPDAKIYYTTGATADDTADPKTSNSKQEYDADAKVTIDADNKVIKAYAAKDTGSSNVVTFTYKLRVAAPTASPENHVLTADGKITLSCATAGADIYYTTDGSTPSASSTSYTEPFAISETSVIKAIAAKADWESSNVSEFLYIVPTEEKAEHTADGDGSKDGYFDLNNCKTGTISSVKSNNVEIYTNIDYNTYTDGTLTADSKVIQVTGGSLPAESTTPAGGKCIIFTTSAKTAKITVWFAAKSSTKEAKFVVAKLVDGKVGAVVYESTETYDRNSFAKEEITLSEPGRYCIGFRGGDSGGGIIPYISVTENPDGGSQEPTSVADPVFDPDGTASKHTFSTKTGSVELSCETEGAVIKYVINKGTNAATDFDAVTADNILENAKVQTYAEGTPITVTESGTKIKAIAIYTKTDSTVIKSTLVSAEYDITADGADLIADPVADPAEGEVDPDTAVALSTSVDGAVIYALEKETGAAPTEAELLVDANKNKTAFTIDKAKTIYAMAVKYDTTDTTKVTAKSGIASFAYTIKSVQPTSHTVTFYDGKTVLQNPAPVTVTTGTLDLDTIAAPTKTGYTFKGWATTENATVPDATGVLTITEDTRLYAVWETAAAETYTVTFMNGSTELADIKQTVSAGTSLDVSKIGPGVAAPEGKVFKGWAKTADGETVTSVTVTENTTLYAVWETISDADKATITLINGKEEKSYTAKKGSSFALTGYEPTAEAGKKFVGWSDKANAKDEKDVKYTSEIAKVEGDLKLYAVFVDAKYTVTFETYTGTTPKEYKANEKFTLDTPTRNGYEFEYWYDDAGKQYKGGTEYTVTGNVTLYQKWKETPLFDNGMDIRYGTATYAGGTAVLPSDIRVYWNKDGEYRRLSRNIDYTVKASNNKKTTVGAKKKATLTITGIGNYKGVKKTVEFDILQRNIEYTTMPEEMTLVKDAKVAPVISYKGKQLKLGKDFTLTEGSNIDAKGKYTGAVTKAEEKNEDGTVKTPAETRPMTVKGIGNFTGETTIDIKVVEKSAAKQLTIQVDKTFKPVYGDDTQYDYLFSGTPKTDDKGNYVYENGKLVYNADKKIKVLDKKSKTELTEGTDFEVVYTSNSDFEAGTVKFTVVGIGEYTGTASKSFKIAPKKAEGIIAGVVKEWKTENNESKPIMEENPEATYTNSKQGAYLDNLEVYCPYKYKDGEAEKTDYYSLTKNYDYKVSYSNNKKAGSAKAKITFIGDYKGTKPITVAFTVVGDTLNDCYVKVPDMTYTKAGKSYVSKPIVEYNGTILKASEYTASYEWVSASGYGKEDKDGKDITDWKKDDKVKVTLEGSDLYAVVRVTITPNAKKSNFKLYQEQTGIGADNKPTYAEVPVIEEYKVTKADKIDLSKAKVEFYKNAKYDAATKKVTFEGTPLKALDFCKDSFYTPWDVTTWGSDAYKDRDDIVYVKVLVNKAEVDPSLYDVTWLCEYNAGKATVVITGKAPESKPATAAEVAVQAESSETDPSGTAGSTTTAAYAAGGKTVTVKINPIKKWIDGSYIKVDDTKEKINNILKNLF